MRFSLSSSHALLEIKYDMQTSYEMVSNAHVQQLTMSFNVAFWEHLGAYRFIRDTTVDVYKIPFIYTPPSAHFINNRSAILYSDFAAQAISDLLATG